MTPLVPPLDILLKCLGVSKEELLGDGDINVSAPALRLIIQQALIAMPIDTDLYAKQNPDLARSYPTREKSALRHHFINRGYFEGRDVTFADFDGEYYASRNADVAKAYLSGAVSSLMEHYLSTGIHEFRAPRQTLEDSVAAWAALSKGRKPR